MSDTPIFDPRLPGYKRPYGAVPAGGRVWFALRPARAEGFSRAWLTARLELDGGRTVEVPLPWRDSWLGRDEFSGVLELGEETGLIWYTLHLEGFGGRRWDSPEYQLTVYDGAEEVPGWFGRGVTYQIFPDRFRRLALPDPAGLPGDRRVHENWFDLPDYRPDPEGKIRNRDFFGGSLAGIEAGLDRLEELGVETLYLCPIFEGAENHRYGTGDYHRIDPMLGGEEDFVRLCRAAHDRGMRVVLDGVFSHTGFVSRYFNGDGFYPDPGAAQSKDSPWYGWYDFQRWPDRYTSWWGIDTLPAVRKENPDYQRFIYDGPDSVVRRWLRLGADGWRLDVADELPDHFVHGIHAAARAEKPWAVVLGEVWEDGTTKVAYGVRRRHLLGGHLDGLMNYPLRTALVDWLLGGDGAGVRETVESLREHYPPWAFASSMNFLGTHDTPRILTLLGAGGDCREKSRDWRAYHRLSPPERALGIARLKLGTLALFALPGSPTIYYGDEAGLEGFEDPFNRRCYPWGREDARLLEWYRALGLLRRHSPALREGELTWEACGGGLLSFRRTAEGEIALAALNASRRPRRLRVNWPGEEAVDGLTGAVLTAEEGALTLELPPLTGRLLLGAE